MEKQIQQIGVKNFLEMLEDCGVSIEIVNVYKDIQKITIFTEDCCDEDEPDSYYFDTNAQKYIHFEDLELILYLEQLQTENEQCQKQIEKLQNTIKENQKLQKELKEDLEKSEKYG